MEPLKIHEIYKNTDSETVVKPTLSGPLLAQESSLCHSFLFQLYLCNFVVKTFGFSDLDHLIEQNS